MLMNRNQNQQTIIETVNTFIVSVSAKYRLFYRVTAVLLLISYS